MSEEELYVPQVSEEKVTVDEIKEIVKSVKVFAGLQESAFKDIAESVERVFVPGGKKIAQAGIQKFAYLIEYGRARIIVPTPYGKENITEYGRGDSFGLILLVSEEFFPGEAFTIRDSTLLRITKPDLLRKMLGITPRESSPLHCSLCPRLVSGPDHG